VNALAGAARWSIDLWLLLPLCAVALAYARGLRGLVGRRGFPSWRPWCFAAGVFVLLVALVSPVDSLGHLLLSFHMLQHWLLMMVAVPLLLLGSAGMVVLRGLPSRLRRGALGPFLASPLCRRMLRTVVHPIFGWTALLVVTAAWHVPALYQAALQRDWIHRLEHASFILAAVLFWYPLVAPWPSRRVWPSAAFIAYVLAADLQNTVFAAILTFSERVLYPVYEPTAAVLGWSPLRDQQLAGAIMWTGTQLIMLPVAVLFVRRALLGDPQEALSPRPRAPLRPRTNDLLRAPFIGAVLRSRRARGVLRWTALSVALAVMVDGWVGPQDAPSNLAGTIPWTHWRGIAVLALLVLGNVFCMTCPLVAARNLLRRFWTPRLRWPRALAGKWIAVVLVVVWLVVYEAFDLWATPAGTAWVMLGFFVAALVVDGLFKGAAFCKSVCPIGQFQMVQSTLSPFGVSVRDASVCRGCETQECIRGAQPRDGLVPLRVAVPGCELELFQPAKRGNLDCTFCLDCVDACPHGNVALQPIRVRDSLASPAWGSSIGRTDGRLDLALLMLVLVFGAFTNAAAMTGPWLELADSLSARWGMATPMLMEGALAFMGVCLLPLGAALAAALASARLGGGGWLGNFNLGAHALVPIGAMMWCVHWTFHLATSAQTVIPASQRAMLDLGIGWFGQPEWAQSCCVPTPAWLLPLELLLLQGGLLCSGWIAWRQRIDRNERHPIRASLPWWILATALWACGTWIVMQPMQMRGTVL
jgi:cytochrome c oxidase assembly factor CtaG/polyferredoxin